jgi:hypothetical protein
LRGDGDECRECRNGNGANHVLPRFQVVCSPAPDFFGNTTARENT